jgi:hypothetical protein
VTSDIGMVGRLDPFMSSNSFQKPGFDQGSSVVRSQGYLHAQGHASYFSAKGRISGGGEKYLRHTERTGTQFFAVKSLE